MKNSELISAIEGYGLYTYKGEYSWMIYLKNCRVDFLIRNDIAYISLQGYGYCPPLIAKTKEEVLECFEMWDRNR